MPSLMDRLREVFGTQPDPHDGEHRDIERRLTEQRLRIARLDADLDARRARERRHLFVTIHPKRRAGDR